MRFVAVLTLALLTANTADAKERYFAVRPLDSSQQLDDFRIGWYSKHLAALGEPSLWLGDHKTETYRMLWLRTFHAPFVFRVTVRPDGTSELTTKKADGHGGYAPGKIVINKTTQIDKKETEILIETLERTKFWDLPTNESGLGETDGAQWIVEAVKDGKYHIVDRRGGGEINGWALLLMRKSGEDLQPIY
ncbi:hypothetical protein [Taklimakanibacter albus]|jgi:hypothetical protein|uniref:Uncharacterized protein n=1 Tax=Taklimakanibacter albus TaxID=2800327 RepID=A0ACC5R438_9HYPH|nr:hypothetical protein [Aestuariivirga sp. YIM B02566]MBK1867363.1 hypothetical protein [Aestuariivirga sp. YIM B02566]